MMTVKGLSSSLSKACTAANEQRRSANRLLSSVLYNSKKQSLNNSNPQRNFASVRQKSNNSNYYEILGVSKKASPKEIKIAYYKKCKLLHPDSNKEDPTSHQKFIAVNTAYETLSQTIARRDYDHSLDGVSPYPNHPSHGFRGRPGNHHDQQQYNGPNGPHQWRDEEYERFIRYAYNQNRYYYGRHGERPKQQPQPVNVEFSAPLRVMMYLILFLAGVEVFAFRQMYDYDINQLHSDRNFSAVNKNTLESLRKEVNSGDETTIDEQIRQHKEIESQPLVHKFEGSPSSSSSGVKT